MSTTTIRPKSSTCTTYAYLLNGSYSAIIGGIAGDALEDFTGGVCEQLDLRDAKYQTEEGRSKLFNLLLEDQGRATLMGAAIEFKEKSGDFKLIRLRNPWGNTEWTGPWSDNSKEWNQVSEEDKKSAGLQVEEDGEFWMSFDHFVSIFSKLDLVHLTADAFGVDATDGSTREGDTGSVRALAGRIKQCWSMDKEFSFWRSNVSAGGSDPKSATYPMNPQFQVEVTVPDTNEKEGTLIVALMQRVDRTNLKDAGSHCNYIGYAIFQEPEQEGVLDRDFFRWHRPIHHSTLLSGRELTERHSLPSGRYVFVPYTMQPNVDGEFLLRIMGEKRHFIDARNEVTSLQRPGPGVAQPNSDKGQKSEAEAKKEQESKEAEKQLFSQLWPLYADQSGEINAFILGDIMGVYHSGELSDKLKKKLSPSQLITIQGILHQAIVNNPSIECA